MRASGWIFFAVFLWALSTASATTVVKMELHEVVKASNFIVEGVVEKVEAQWDAGKKLIHTDIRIRVAESLKGRPDRTVTIRQLGGTVGGLTLDVPGMPHFQIGEQAILFLRRQKQGPAYDVVGLNQGLYKIVEDFAVSNISGVDLLDPKTGQTTRPLFVQRVPLTEFKNRVREIVVREKD